MKEELQIEQAARLADTEAPENISTERARDFVARTMRSRESQNRKKTWFGRLFCERPALAWGGSAFAFAAAAAIAIALILPTNGVTNVGSTVLEMESMHAESELIDTAAVAPADTLVTFELPVAE